MKRLLIILILTSVALGQGEGHLEIVNVAFGQNHWCSRANIIRSGLPPDYDFILDEIDYADIEMNVADCHCPFLSEIYSSSFVLSLVENHNLLYDYRPADGSNDIYSINLAICGLDMGGTNYLDITYYIPGDAPPNYEPFEGKILILKSGDLMYGQFVLLRYLLMSPPYPNGRWRLYLRNIEDISSYTPVVYASLHLLILHPTRFVEFILFDFNGDGSIDLSDYNLLANSWGNQDFGLRMDISGIYGIPDGVVDYYDLDMFLQVWMNE